MIAGNNLEKVSEGKIEVSTQVKTLGPTFNKAEENLLEE